MQEISKARYLVSGDDAETFLHGQLTNDLKALAVGQTQLSAYLTPQGRTLAVLDVTRTDAGFVLTLPVEIAETVIKRLTMFVLRAKVSIVAEESIEHVPTNDYIEQGIPVILAATQDAFVPQMINLDLVDAVSFQKGCYPGQEIVARMKFLGKTKRRMFRFSGEGEGELPVAGDEVHCDGKKVGQVVLAAVTDAGFALLASMQMDSADAELTVGTARLTRQALPYDVPLDGSTKAE